VSCVLCITVLIPRCSGDGVPCLGSVLLWESGVGWVVGGSVYGRLAFRRVLKIAFGNMVWGVIQVVARGEICVGMESFYSI
jgi:hypothetical protein